MDQQSSCQETSLAYATLHYTTAVSSFVSWRTFSLFIPSHRRFATVTFVTDIESDVGSQFEINLEAVYNVLPNTRRLYVVVSKSGFTGQRLLLARSKVRALSRGHYLYIIALRQRIWNITAIAASGCRSFLTRELLPQPVKVSGGGATWKDTDLVFDTTLNT